MADFNGQYGSSQGGLQQRRQRTYNVDLVFVIDATGSMEDTTGEGDKIINTVKKNALNFYNDFMAKMDGKHKHVHQLRVRVVAYRDYLADGDQAMLVTNFFQLPQQTEDFQACIHSIHADGGGDIPEDGLEALAYAIRSPWTADGDKQRHVIVVWSDACTHELGFGRAAANYPTGMPANMSELSEWWDRYMDGSSKRLLLFTPNEPGWSTISDNWDNVIHYPSVTGNGLQEVNYNQILDVLASSV